MGDEEEMKDSGGGDFSERGYDLESRDPAEQGGKGSGGNDGMRAVNREEGGLPQGGWTRLDYATLGLGAVVLGTSVWLATKVESRMDAGKHGRAVSGNVGKPSRTAGSVPVYQVGSGAEPAAAGNDGHGSLPQKEAAAAEWPAGKEQPASLIEREGSGEDAAKSLLIFRQQPKYPLEARRRGVQGAVVLEVWIGKDGWVQAVKVKSGPPLLVAAAVDSVKKWRFTGEASTGPAVEMETTVTIHFKLAG